jgi:hypothetical protein
MRAQRSCILPVSTTISGNRNGEHIEFVEWMVLVANSLRNFIMFAAIVEMSSYKLVILAHSISRYPLSTLQHVRGVSLWRSYVIREIPGKVCSIDTR